MEPQQENNDSSETKHKAKEECGLTYKESKIAVMKKLKELQENSAGSVHSGIKSMNRRNTLPERLKL